MKCMIFQKIFGKASFAVLSDRIACRQDGAAYIQNSEWRPSQRKAVAKEMESSVDLLSLR